MISDALKEAWGEEAPLIVAQIIGVIFLTVVSVFLAVFA
tara:strand:+ start:375 stop:491 length:117 start_codon:yes stop_codon:yes gene_type:complete